MGVAKGSTLHIWTIEEKEFLKQIVTGHHHREIQELMNKKFNSDFTINQIKAAVKRYGLLTGFTGQFEKGSIPLNKGIKGVCSEECKKTWFKRGHTPINHKEVGSERIDVDGYILIKVAEPNKWRMKHQVIWEQHHGKIPKGHVVIFGDGNRHNLDIDNLIMVTNNELLILNRNKLIQEDAELTRTGVNIAKVIQKISERKDKTKNSK